ncbi:MAG: lipoyl(octanoyl) transferase LipB [Thermoleophilaceae bacterium]
MAVPDTLAPSRRPSPRAPAERAEIWVANAGRIDYDDALEIQTELRGRRQAGEIPDALLLLEHPPVYTKGRRSERGDLPMGEDWYRAQGIAVTPASRGGRVTYHGPGQLVGYPIVELADVIAYLRTLERALITALADEGVDARVRDGLTGVWVGERKIASIGVHVSRGVSMHGFAVNVDCDLQPFEWIVPCGIEGVQMTSLLRETGRRDSMPCFRQRVASRLADAFCRRQRIVSLDHLRSVRASEVPASV